eukprot:3803414-Pyramimonas_sp.AAC.1
MPRVPSASTLRAHPLEGHVQATPKAVREEAEPEPGVPPDKGAERLEGQPRPLSSAEMTGQVCLTDAVA